MREIRAPSPIPASRLVVARYGPHQVASPVNDEPTMTHRSELPSRPDLEAIHELNAMAYSHLHAAHAAVAGAVIGPIEAWMTADHARLARLLARVERRGGRIDDAAYALVRAGLLRHFAIEESVLLPFVRARRGGVSHPAAPAMREGHAAIASLLDAPPTGALLEMLRDALARHHAIEEGPDGLYAACDALAGDDANALLVRIRMQPPIAKYRARSLVRIS
jgi:hypothetical protein